MAAVKFSFDDDPDARQDDYQLTLFGVNSGRGEILYNSSMQTLAIYGGEGGGEGQFRDPHGIAATPDGRIYVADTGNRRVARLRWNDRARSLRWAGEWPAGELFDVAADARGQVYASDRTSDGVLRFSETAAPSPVTGERWPLPPDVEDPLGLAVADSLDPWYHRDDYRLYLIDRDGDRLRAYAADGEVLAETSPDRLPRSTGPPGRFGYVALDYYGNVYVTDGIADVVYKFDPDLRPLTTFPGTGPEEAALDEPRGIAIWKRFGQVFVAEREGAQYYFLGTDFRTAEPVLVRRFEDPPRWGFDLFLTEAAIVTATFLGAAGDTLGIAETGVYGTGEQPVAWGAGAWKSVPAQGWEDHAERLSIEARPTYSSRKRFSLIRTFPLAWNRP